jgi:prophage regulatory protein
MNIPVRTAEQLVAAAYDAERPIPRLIKIDEVCKIIGLGKSAVYEYAAQGKFPRPIKLGTSQRGAVRWVLSEVLDFVDKLVSERVPVTPRVEVVPVVIKPAVPQPAPLPPKRKSTLFSRRGRS